jgi:general secretion pathway protein M
LSGPPRSRYAPLLALAILVALVATVAGLTLWPLWRTAQDDKQTIATLEQRLLVQRRIAAESAELQPRLQEIEKGYASDAHYLKSASQTLAGAEIQEIVKRAILAKHGELLSSQIVRSEPQRRAQRVTLGIALRASLEQIVQILYALETGKPLLFIDTASFRIRTAPTARMGAATPAPAQLLDVQIQLSGYFRQGPV